VERIMVTIGQLTSIGIDVSKETLVVSGLSTSRAAVRARQFANSRAGVRGLIAFLNSKGRWQPSLVSLNQQAITISCQR
jgi:hypothetical protein